MGLLVYWIDAFAEQVFEGNPAVVAPLLDLSLEEDWPADDLLQAMASEHNQSETAYIRPTGEVGRWRLRWFTPTTEVPICGHATLASGAVVLDILAPDADQVTFDTQSGPLIVTRSGDHYSLDLPHKPRRPWTPPASVTEALDASPEDSFQGEYPVIVLADEDAVRELSLAQGVAASRSLDADRPGSLLVTAPGADGLDFVARFFAPGYGIDEDPFTGSAFADLAPYWTQRLSRGEVTGFQASPRGGRALCRVPELGRVTLIGGAVEYMRGEVMI